MTVWMVRLQLRYGSRRPEAVRELHMAVHSRDPVETANLLRGFPEFTTTVPGVEDALRAQFAGSAELPRLLGLVRAGAGTRADVNQWQHGAHYERGRPGTPTAGQWELRRHADMAKYRLVRAADELRVVVTIRLVEDNTDDPSKRLTTAIVNRWRDGIQRKWNRGYRAENGAASLRIIFVPIFRYYISAIDSARITAEERNTTTMNHIVHVWSEPRREDSGHWSLQTDAETAAHEFGHLMGLRDEYRLPGTIAEARAAGLSEADARRSSIEGITGRARPARMGGYDMGGMMSENDVVQDRHVQPIVDELNARLLAGGEAQFRLVPPAAR